MINDGTRLKRAVSRHQVSLMDATALHIRVRVQCSVNQESPEAQSRSATESSFRARRNLRGKLGERLRAQALQQGMLAVAQGIRH